MKRKIIPHPQSFGFLPAILGASMLFALNPAKAQAIFQWGESSDYVTSGRPLRDIGGDSVTTNTFNRAYSESWSITPISGYSGPTLFGGWEVTAGSLSAATAANQVANNRPDLGGNDALFFRTQPSSATTTTLNGLVVGDLSESVAFSALESFVVTGIRNGVGAFNLRPVIQANGSYYIGSNATAIGTVYPLESMLDIEANNWNTYNPLSSIGSVGSSLSLDGTEEVTRVGFWFERSTGSGATMDTLVSNFSVTAIPEPSAYGSIFGFLALSLLAARRKMIF